MSTVTARSPHAFFLSAALHAVVVGICFLIAYSFRPDTKPPEKIFELVAGSGDNYNATVAPAIGSLDGVKVNVPKAPTPKAETQKAEAPVAEPPKVVEKA